VALLLQKGADITIRGENGSPVAIAKEEKHDAIVALLQSKSVYSFLLDVLLILPNYNRVGQR